MSDILTDRAERFAEEFDIHKGMAWNILDICDALYMHPRNKRGPQEIYEFPMLLLKEGKSAYYVLSVLKATLEAMK